MAKIVCVINKNYLQGYILGDIWQHNDRQFLHCYPACVEKLHSLITVQYIVPGYLLWQSLGVWLLL